MVRPKIDIGDDKKLEALKSTKGSVFVTHSVADGPIANELAALLIAEGYRVTASSMVDIATGTDWQREIKDSTKRADVNVVLISPGMSEYTSSAISHMLASEKPIEGKLLPVLLGRVELEENLGNLQSLRISSINEIEIVVEAVEKLINSTHRTRSRKKLYAARDKSGQFKDIQTYKRAHGQDIKKKSKKNK